MEISGKTQRYPLHVQHPFTDRDRTETTTRPTGADEADDVRLSGQGNMIRDAIQQLRTVPDIRADRVAAIRQQLESGAYRTDGARIVSGLLSEAEENNDILRQIDTDG